MPWSFYYCQNNQQNFFLVRFDFRKKLASIGIGASEHLQKSKKGSGWNKSHVKWLCKTFLRAKNYAFDKRFIFYIQMVGAFPSLAYIILQFILHYDRVSMEKNLKLCHNFDTLKVFESMQKHSW